MDAQYQLAADGTPTFTPNSQGAARLVSLAASVALAEGWEAADGEELAVLVLHDPHGALVGAIPAPISDEAWLSALERTRTLIITGGQHPKALNVLPG